MRDRHRIRDALVFGLYLILFILVAGCRTHQPAVQQPIVLENVTEQTDTIKESHREADIQQERSKEQTTESTTEKITVVVTQQGDTVRTDREVTTIRDHWLMSENIRLQAKIDSLIFNQSLREKIEVPVPYPVEVIVEKELSLWQQIRLKGFWVLAGALAGIAVYHWRKPIIRFLMRYL